MMDQGKTTIEDFEEEPELLSAAEYIEELVKQFGIGNLKSKKPEREKEKE